MGLADPGPPRARAHRSASRPPPARSARASATRSAWRWRPAASAACSTRTPRPARARSTTTSTRSAPTATSRRASATRSARSPATSSWATSSCIWDDNEISIEDDTRIAKREDVAARYEAYGWHVQTVDWRRGHADRASTTRTSRRCTPRCWRPRRRPTGPSFIALRTIIGWPAPEQAEHRQDPRLGAGRRRGRRHQGDPRLRPGRQLRRRRRGARARPRGRRARPAAARRVAAGRSTPGRAANPERTALFDRLATRTPARGLDRRAARRSRPTPRASPPGRPPARSSTRSRRCCPSCGAARPTWPRATTPR